MSAQHSEAPEAPANLSTFGVPTFTKLDANGAALPPAADTWASVLVTLGDQSIQVLNGNIGGRRMPQEEGVTACTNAAALGYTDWRMWDVREALAVANHAAFNPAVDTNFFPDIEPSWYWTASPDASAPACAWRVGFYYGNADLGFRGGHGFVRAVRSVSSAPASQ